MVGNLWEWVAEWKASGISWMGGVGAGSLPWPAGVGYGDDSDLVVNNNGRALTKTMYVNGAPAAAIRGGGFSQSTNSGAFAVGFHIAPSFFNSSVGARCCVRGK
jgi:formylglycine-generating enzyme required for sulfatase activity